MISQKNYTRENELFYTFYPNYYPKLALKTNIFKRSMKMERLVAVIIFKGFWWQTHCCRLPPIKNHMVVTLPNNNPVNSCGVPMTDNVTRVCFRLAQLSLLTRLTRFTDLTFSVCHTVYRPEKRKGETTAFTSNVPRCEA